MRTLLIAAILLAACAPRPAPPPAFEYPEAGPSDWLLPGTRWLLVELNGAPYAAEFTARLTTDGRIQGQGPCNPFTAGYLGDWPNLSFTPDPVTETACPELAAERAALAAITRVERGDVREEGLVFTGPDTYLRFERI